MIKNYIKIAWRNLVKGKLYSVINISGLAVGIACCLLIGLYVYNELRYDRFHEKGDQIYRVNYTLLGQNETFNTAQTPKPLAPFLTENFSEIKQAVRLQNEDGVIRIQNRLFKEKFLIAEQGFLDVFSFKLLQGNPETAFSEREQILLTQTTAQKLFGSENIIGKPLELRIDGEYYQASVGGILEDPPEYSSISFKVVIPLEFWKKVDRSYERGNNWRTFGQATYVLLAENSNAGMLGGKTKQMIETHLSESIMDGRSIEFQPIKDIHFDGSVQGGLSTTANVNLIYISAAIAILILVIACINFMSISVGHSARRAREVGMRKAMGALRTQIMKQFWGETFLTVLFSLGLGLLLTELLLPYFNHIVGKSMTLNWMETPLLFFMVIGTVLITGLLAGSYPAIYLSRFQPSQVFQNKIKVEGRHGLIQFLSGTQFTLAIVLIIGTLFMNQQMDLLLNKNLGFNKDQVIQVEVPFEEGKSIVNNLQTALSPETLVKHVSGSWETLGKERNGFQLANIEAGDQEISGYTYGTDPEHPKTLGLEVTVGRVYRSPEDIGGRQEVLVNQKLVDTFGWENPIGKKLSRMFAFNEAEVVGVVKDFHFQSLHQPIEPLVIYPTEYYTMAYIRLGGGQIEDALTVAETAWNKVAPGLPFDFTFLDQAIDQQYRADIQREQIVTLASAIAIMLACMGLFGLATLAMAKRTKEISIRKVFGATSAGIAILLSKDFLKPVVIALCFAIPLSYLLIQQWLQNFAYKIEIDPGTYLIATVVVIVLALLTVSWQSIRAAVANPADSLRSE
ncbi:MAG: ABC transporter permease [Candidatus Halalkalibacterium sp. M3_1C_030]